MIMLCQNWYGVVNAASTNAHAYMRGYRFGLGYASCMHVQGVACVDECINGMRGTVDLTA